MVFVLKSLLWLLALLPLPILHCAGYVLGWLFFLIPNRRRSTTITNITLCFPELSRWQRWQLIRRSLIETNKGALESSAMWMRSGKRALKLVRETVNLELLEQAYARDKGVILALPHLGMWEIIALYCSSRFPMTTLYRPPPISGMDSTMRSGREQLGAKLVPTNAQGVRALYKALSNGELVAILPDQDPAHGQGEFAPFFGVQANTMVLLSRLANKTGASVICGWAERLSWGRGYRIHFNSIDNSVFSNESTSAIATLNKSVEQCIRNKPEQYLWCYKRFRTRPAGENKIYKR
ncbi:MAG: lysophospholipid acyltransferase family protein [Proteobacteria bacterium]|nr:lysophospholipid acyltransferase family protein [Pseudomonadota bacterium]